MSDKRNRRSSDSQFDYPSSQKKDDDQETLSMTSEKSNSSFINEPVQQWPQWSLGNDPSLYNRGLPNYPPQYLSRSPVYSKPLVNPHYNMGNGFTKTMVRGPVYSPTQLEQMKKNQEQFLKKQQQFSQYQYQPQTAPYQQPQQIYPQQQQTFAQQKQQQQQIFAPQQQQQQIFAPQQYPVQQQQQQKYAPQQYPVQQQQQKYAPQQYPVQQKMPQQVQKVAKNKSKK